MPSTNPADLVLRLATMDDAEILLSWRNDPQTIAGSRDHRPVDLADHMKWLAGVLVAANRTLLVAEAAGRPVGTVRIDSGSDGAELSWTVAPTHRGRGYGRQMVQEAIAREGGLYWAETRPDNLASIRLVQSLGFQRGATHDGIVRWHLDKRRGELEV
jgi:RimJ/RimL family protein N-acetyltransferase